MTSDYRISQGYQPVAAIGVDARASFINRTYNHLMGAIVLFALMFWYVLRLFMSRND